MRGVAVRVLCLDLVAYRHGVVCFAFFDTFIVALSGSPAAQSGGAISWCENLPFAETLVILRFVFSRALFKFEVQAVFL